jgi:hypothetical protein
MAIYNEVGFFQWLKSSVAVAQMAHEGEAVETWVAVNNPRLVPVLMRFLDPTERIATSVGQHAEMILLKIAEEGGYDKLYSIAAGRTICWACAQAILKAGFAACGPNANPWF